MSEESVGEIAVDPEPVEDSMVDEGVAEAPEPERGISESQDILKALGRVADLYGKLLSDGVVNFSDIVHVVDELKSVEVYVNAVKGAGDVDDELKDLDESELIALGLSAIKIVKRFIDAAKSSKAVK